MCQSRLGHCIGRRLASKQVDNRDARFQVGDGTRSGSQWTSQPVPGYRVSTCDHRAVRQSDEIRLVSRGHGNATRKWVGGTAERAYEIRPGCYNRLGSATQEGYQATIKTKHYKPDNHTYA